MTELIDFFNRHELLGFVIVGLWFVISTIQETARKISLQLNYTNRYLLLLVQSNYSNKEILEETSDLRPEPTFWDKLFK
jgi:hypothetical protein